MSEGGNQDSEKEFKVAAFLLLSTFIVKNLLLLFFSKCFQQSVDRSLKMLLDLMPF